LYTAVLDHAETVPHDWSSGVEEALGTEVVPETVDVAFVGATLVDAVLSPSQALTKKKKKDVREHSSEIC
jgi:hypothetical protein